MEIQVGGRKGAGPRAGGGEKKKKKDNKKCDD